MVATGGYEGDREMANAVHMPGLLFPTVGAPGNTGDGLKMLMAAGAKAQNFGKTLEYCALSFKKVSEEVGTGIVLGQGVGVNAFSDGYIFVNRDGERFMDESKDLTHCKDDLAINAFTGGASKNASATGYVNLPASIVLDEATFESGPLGRRPGAGGWGWNTGYPGHHNLHEWSDDNQDEVQRGWLVKADTLEELAPLMAAADMWGNEAAIDPGVLAWTVAGYNVACEAGADEAFGRSAETLVALGDRPYYAAEMSLTTIYTTSGAAQDTRARVLDWAGEAICRAFVSLLETTPVERVKVSDVIELADVSRSSFYRQTSEACACALPWGRCARNRPHSRGEARL